MLQESPTRLSRCVSASWGAADPQPSLCQALLAKAPGTARSGNGNKGFAHPQHHSRETPRLHLTCCKSRDAAAPSTIEK